jgi:hypothetical protein
MQVILIIVAQAWLVSAVVCDIIITCVLSIIVRAFPLSLPQKKLLISLIEVLPLQVKHQVYKDGRDAI